MGTAPAPASEGTKSTTKTATKASGAGTKAKPPARRKKPSTPSKAASASANQATYSAARTAQMELAGQRSAAAARLSDPLWYRVEDILPATTDETAMAMPATKVLPEQVQIVETALSNNNMTRSDVTPQAFCVLLEQARRYALEIIADAQDYAVFASRTEISQPDLELASQMRPDFPIAVSTQLPKLNLLSQQINRVPLPPIPTQCFSGVLLPPKHHQLTARTFDVVSCAQVAQKMVQPKPSIANKKSSTSSTKTTPKPSYGAARGRQIPIQLKEREPEHKEVTSGAIAAASSSDAGPTPMEISSPLFPAAASETPGAVPTSATDRSDPKPVLTINDSTPSGGPPQTNAPPGTTSGELRSDQP